MPTAQEIEQRKAKWWGPERNAKRREKYAKDAAYRQKERDRVRVRSQKPDEPVYDPRERLAELPTLATLVRVFTRSGEDRGQQRVFTTEEVADLLGRKVQALYRWRSDKKFPEGLLYCKAPTGNMKQVYTLPEATAIIRVLGAHLVETPYYHEQHTETRDALFAAVEQARTA